VLSNIRRRAPVRLKEEERIKPFHFYATLLQTDARMHLGCSGGALFNLAGEMVGLITSVAAIQGGETPGGFAVPINAPITRIIDVLKRGEELDYGFLGVGFDERNGNDQPGVTLKAVGPDSPADLDGRLQTGDVLLAVNGHAIEDGDDVYTTIGMNLAGSKVQLQVRRNGIVRIAEVTLAKLLVPGKHIASSTGSRPFFRGLRVDYSSLVVQGQIRAFARMPRGVLISEVKPNTAAARAKLKSGDIITHVNRIPVTTPAAFYHGVANAVGPLELGLYGVVEKTTLR
jgi:serine protease Do